MGPDLVRMGLAVGRALHVHLYLYTDGREAFAFRPSALKMRSIADRFGRVRYGASAAICHHTRSLFR